MTTQTNDADVKIYNQLSDKFHQENPGITVKISAVDGTNYDQKLLTYIQAGTLPDIVQTSDNYAKPFKDAGITQDMIPFAQKTNFPYQDFDPTFLNLGMVDGQLHMLPKQGDVIIMVNGERVDSSTALVAQIREMRAGEQAKLTVIRNGQRLELDVTLAVKPASSGG